MPGTASVDLSREQLVTEIYRGIFDRAPDPDGLAHHIALLDRGSRLAELLHGFVVSAEFHARQASPTANASRADSFRRVDRDPPLAIALDPTPAQRRALWAHIAATWGRLGDEDPYWSVFSAPRYRMQHMTDEAVLDEFYQSGRGELARLDAWLHRNGLVLGADMVCAEYGCGVGRLTGWLAERCASLRAFDISATHLNRARGWLARLGRGNVEPILVRTPADLRLLAGTDLFFSMIVLQHNPPPIMQLILGEAFRSLNPGGIAYFQLPTYMPGYRFETAEYIAGLQGTGQIEMHCLPQGAVFALAAQHGMTPLQVEQDSLIGSCGTSHTFLLRKAL